MDLWADYAGLDYTSGELIDILNCFMMRQVFQISKSIRILAPVSREQISDSRGVELRKHVSILKNMFSQDIEACSQATLPIITKCKLSDADSNDVDCLRSTADEILQAELDVER